MKFPKELIAGSLALGMMVISVRAEDPVVPIAKPIDVTDVSDKSDDDNLIDVTFNVTDDLTDNGGDDTAIDVTVVYKGTGGEEVLDTETEVTDDVLIYASGANIRNLDTTSAPAPVISTDAGKDEASTAKAAGVSTPAKSIASAGKRTSAVVKSGRVFLTH